MYEIGVALILGVLLGVFFQIALKFSEEKNWIDKRNFLVFEIAFAGFASGIANVLGVSSFITTFTAGITFSWVRTFIQLNVRMVGFKKKLKKRMSKKSSIC